MNGSMRRTIEDILGHPLGDAQWAAVTAPPEPAAIVAGAGSGKTTVMAARVLWLVLEGYAAPDQVLGLTFTTKAAAELLGRTRSFLAEARRRGLLDDAAEIDPVVSTYHSFAARLLSDDGVLLGLEPGAAVLSDGARQSLGIRVVRSTRLPLADLERRLPDLVQAMLSLDDRLAELAIAPDAIIEDATDLIADLHGRGDLQRIGRDMLDTARVRAALAGLVDEFRRAKLERQVVDFADQVRWALDIVRGSGQVRTDLRARSAVVLLDEYQDTSVAQRMLLQAAFGEGHPVTAVGDPCQAIYEWRGASVDNIDRFPDHFPRLDGRPATRYTLVDNRRSGPAILDLANEIAAPLRAIHPGVEPLVPAAASTKGPGVVRCGLFTTSAEETEWVADEIVRLGEAAGSWSDITVLARTAEILARVHAALRSRSVPTEIVGAAALLQVPAVVEVRAILELIDDPCANAAAVRLLAGPRWRIGPRDLAALGSLAGQGRHRSADRASEAYDPDRLLREAVLGSDPADRVSLLEAAERATEEEFRDRFSAEARTRLFAFAREMRELRRHRDEHPTDLIGRILKVTGLGVEMGMSHGDDDIEVIENARAMSAFRDLAARFEDRDQPGSWVSGRPSLGAFLRRLQDAEYYDAAPSVDMPAVGNAVQMMTIHKAKGLENRHVLVPGMSRGEFPTAKGRDRWPTSAAVVPWHLRDDAPAGVLGFPDPAEGPRDKHHKEFVAASADLEKDEERRLAYVALTRAESTLTVTGHWWGPSQTRSRGPGIFLEEVRGWCQAGGGHVVTWADAPADGETNPQMEDRSVPWPNVVDPAAFERRRAIAQEVAAGAAVETEPMPLDHPRVARWDLSWQRLRAEAWQAREPRPVSLPTSLSASDVVRWQEDPDALALDLARPMPRRPHAAARRGTAVHGWIEARYSVQPLIEIEDLPGSADDMARDAELERLRAAFLATEYADRTPVAVEAPFAVAVGGRLLRGRIDAVFERDGRTEVVDWKTGGHRSVRDLQLGIYRLAWSQLSGTPLDRIDGAFVMVGSGEIIRPSVLPGPEEIAALLS